MNNTPKMKWSEIFALGFCSILFLSPFFVVPNKLSLANNSNQHAQIIKTESNLLNNWQQNMVLENNHKFNTNDNYAVLQQKIFTQYQAIYQQYFVGIGTTIALDKQGIIYNKTNTDAHELPAFKKNVGELILSANSSISTFISAGGKEKILFEKNNDIQLPVASITKLMTALVASEQYKPNDIISVSENSLGGKGMSGIYQTGNRFLFLDALHALLISSHNEIANTLAEQNGNNQFLDSMNKKTLTLGLADTIFFNATGLDPNTDSDKVNRSTVFDIYKLTRYVQENHPDIISITSQKQFALFDTNKNFVTTINNTNKLLGHPNVPFRILGGKTGETPRARQNLTIVTEAPCGGKIFSVVLGSQNSFDDMKKLLWYVNDSYQWNC